MKKKFISAFLFGAFTLAATNTFVSCKDYDDDISNLQAQVDDLAALKNVKTELESEITSLKTQLEAADGELQTAINSKADASTVTALQTTVAALETRISTAESAITSINTLLASKVDKSTYDTEIANIWAKVNAVDTSLATALTNISTLQSGLADEILARQAVAADLAEQVSALDAIEALYDDNTKISEIKTMISNLQSQLNSYGIDEMKTQLSNLVTKVDELSAEINVLNVLVKDSLRSLVFRPDAYYWGVEATKLYYLDYYKYSLTETAYNNCETSTQGTAHDASYKGRGYEESINVLGTTGASRTIHARYDSVAASKVLSFMACYHMNPSNADLSKASVSVLSDDKTYIHDTRSAACGLSVKDWSTEAGILKVNMNVSDPTLIKKASEDAITVFATQVNLKKGGDKDTTITSDYATLYKESIKDVRLAHRAGTDVPFYVTTTNPTGVENTHCGECSLTGNHNHLMATAFEAKTFAPQDYCLYNSTLDLTKLVETHYTTASGKHAVMTATDLEGAGLEYQFELTGLYLGTNTTSESAHAAISGTTFRPQMPEYDENHIGKQQAYGATQDRQEIGRTPLVRVKLVDKESGDVLDYGYIRIIITEKQEDTPVPVTTVEQVSYTGSDWMYDYGCTANGWSYSTRWIQTEYDIYNKLGLTREEFEEEYRLATETNAHPVQNTTLGACQQYIPSGLDANGNYTTFTKAADSEFIGTVNDIADPSSEDGTMTSTLTWTITGTDMLNYLKAGNKGPLVRAIKYESRTRQHEDIYVVFHTGTLSYGVKPYAAGNLADKKNANYWYTWNGASDEGFDEVHSNTITPEDNVGGTAYDLDNRFSDLFVGNKFIVTDIDDPSKGYIKDLVDNTANGDYALSKLSLDFRFAAENVGKEYKGYVSADEVVTYVMSISADGKTLYANIKGQTTKQAVAKITGTDLKTMKVELVHNADNNGYSESLLNYRAHNALADDVLNAIIGLYAYNQCDEQLDLTDNTFNVRFLRPLNVKDAGKTIEDANTTTVQRIYLKDLVKFTDWRDAWNASTYLTYYGVKAIGIEDVNSGDRISSNEEVKSNQHYYDTDPTHFESLKLINDQVDFIYHNNGTASDGSDDYLEYKNFSSTVTQFDVVIPIYVEYVWGRLYTNVTVTVKRTASN